MHSLYGQPAVMLDVVMDSRHSKHGSVIYTRLAPTVAPLLVNNKQQLNNIFGSLPLDNCGCDLK